MASQPPWRLWRGSKRRKLSIAPDHFAFPVDDEDEDSPRRDPVKLGQLSAREALASQVSNKARGDPSPLELEAASAWMRSTCTNPACKAELLNTLKRQIDKGRANVQHKDARGVTQQIVLGILPRRRLYAGIPMPTASIWRLPGLCALLLRYLRPSEAGAEDSHIDSFEITNIQLTRNLRSAPHVDCYNKGPSYIAAFGSLQKGELWGGCAHGPQLHRLNKDIRGRTMYRKNQRVRGRLLEPTDLLRG